VGVRVFSNKILLRKIKIKLAFDFLGKEVKNTKNPKKKVFGEAYN
jgi:hypothetical protein